ncbi:pseudouridine synthase [Clostridium chromiireducens]|uniref:Pseudouridine synthase n=1 Tax=Clostridium chromiireducens TaxID=225345 RepID=A0A1V4IR45_9CLOT|nr:pseudouridine synthase [Clostridium chromiireducens]OPJ62349.1 ribosomal large subunit pseudouridine synthase F [Clostridium chromiireducens]
MRINKLFSNYGICSRKETNKLIEEKRVKVNGKLCVLGQWVEDADEILLDDRPILMKEKVYIALNKPVGITCTAENNDKDNIIHFMKYPQYIFPVGRLDKDSQGLIILTNDGELANELLECENMHEKEYIVEVDRDFNDEFIAELSQGVDILSNVSSGIRRISDNLGVCKDEFNKNTLLSRDDLGNINAVNLKDINVKNKKDFIRTRECKVNRISSNSFKIILTQGLNRQIRKMCGAFGFKVTKLERIRILNINIENIDVGEWRYLSKDEIEDLKRKLNINLEEIK